MDNNELSKRFQRGLKANGITEEELHNDYYYIGGDFSYHLTYCQKNIRCRKKFTMTPLPSYIILSFK